MKNKFCRRSKFFSIGMLVFLMLFIIACGSSDDTLPTYNISGAVSGATVAGVTINLTGAATATATTDVSGNYSFTGRANGSYTVTPVKAGYAFNPAGLAVTVSGANVTGKNFVATANSAATYSISGSVSGDATSGVTITLGGANTASVATGVGGTYTISGLLPGDYTVTPSRTGFTFSPTNSDVTIAAANSTANNFVATAIPVAHSLSGTVSGDTLSGVTITVTGTATATATTDGSGNYSVPSLYDGSYTVTPTKAGYTFTPTSTAVTMSGANITGKNFVATANVLPTHSISGAVTLSGAGLSGVTITLSGAGSATTTTNTSGNYSFSGIVNGNYTVTPSMTGYTFAPSSRAATVSGGDVTVPNFVATANTTTYSQADLTGTWRLNNLRTGSDNGGNKWLRAMFSINSSGVATCLSMSDSGGGTTCPSSTDLTLTMNSSTGVITQTGADATDAGTGHMTMTSNKNFIAGTGTNTGGSSNSRYQLAIMQKVVPGTSYSNADLQSKSFVYHNLMVGADLQWSRGDGTTDATGMVSLANDISPSGDHGAQPNVGRFSVDASGTVTIGTVSGLFLSADKKTIVGVQTEIKGTSTYYSFMIFQITGQTYTAGPLPVGISAAHMLAVGASPAPFWVHFTATVASGGVITDSDWVASNAGLTGPGTTDHGSISASGTVTIAGSDFHGQVSDDSKFIVATQTLDTGIYALSIMTQ